MSALTREWIAFLVFSNLTLIVLSIVYPEFYQEWTMYLALICLILMDILAFIIYLRTRG